MMTFDSVKEKPDNTPSWVKPKAATRPESAPTAIEKPVVNTELPAPEKTPTGHVVVTVPKDFWLRLSYEEIVHIKAGVQKMPLEQAEHFYAKANGVEIFKLEN